MPRSKLPKIDPNASLTKQALQEPRARAHPETEVLTRGFDPRLSVGSVRPAVSRARGARAQW